MPNTCKIVLGCFLWFLVSSSAQAQWVTQTVSLKAGWNAVYLEVQPEPPQCDLQFEGLPVNSVWTYDPRFAGPEFIQDPSELTPEIPDWRSYFPPGHPFSFATNLFILGAGRSYLINVTEATVWNVVGRPVLTLQQWKPDRYNLTGFPVDPDNLPTFTSWFAGSDAHTPLEVWSLGMDNQWERVTSPLSTTIQSGQAYFVFSNGQSDFQGPLEVRLTEGVDLNYERALVEHHIEIERVGSGTRSVSISSFPSQAAPDTSLPFVLGEVPLAYFSLTGEADSVVFAYHALPAEITFSPDDTDAKLFKIAVERQKMIAASGTGLYQSVLRIKDDIGAQRLIGVRSRGRVPQAKAGQVKGATSANPTAGLWVGSVTLDRVTEREREVDVLTPVSAEFSFRVLLHMDSDGTVRLLNEVTQYWRNGTFRPDAENPDLEIIDQPGHYLLLTPTAPQSLLNEIGSTVVPGTLRDGRAFARRISTAAFSLRDATGNPEVPVMNLAGPFGEGGSELQVSLVLDDSNPMNPFHHQFHPQHRYPKPGDPFVASNDYTINWNLTFTFSSEPLDGLVLAGWGDTHVGGVFEEELIGLTRNPIKARGLFRLQRASTVAVLNDGLGS